MQLVELEYPTPGAKFPLTHIFSDTLALLQLATPGAKFPLTHIFFGYSSTTTSYTGIVSSALTRSDPGSLQYCCDYTPALIDAVQKIFITQMAINYTTGFAVAVMSLILEHLQPIFNVHGEV